MVSDTPATTIESSTETLLFKHFCRSVAEIQWLLIILVLLYLVTLGDGLDASPSLLITVAAYFLFSLAGNFLTFFDFNRRLLIAVHTLVMLAFVTTIIYLTDGAKGPLVSLYLVAIITSALALGKLATLLEVVAVAACYLLLMQHGASSFSFDSSATPLITANLVTFLLVGYLTTTLAEAIHSANEHLKAVPRLEQSMAATLQRWKYVVNQSSDAFFEVDGEGRVTEWNPRASLMFGWSQNEAIGEQLAELIILPENRAEQFDSLHKMFGVDGHVSERRVLARAMRRDGTVLPVEVLIHDIRMPDAHYFNAFVQDVSEREARQSQLIERAHQDAVTQLANRHVLDERLSMLLSRPHNGTISLLYLIDLDNFKSINDDYGHTVCDSLLREVATRIKDVTRERDLVARMGGDEFVVVMEQIKPLAVAQLEQIAEKLRQATAAPYEIDEHSITITVSMGASVYRGGSETKQSWLKRADAAMYIAKHEGKNRCHIDAGDSAKPPLALSAPVENKSRV